MRRRGIFAATSTLVITLGWVQAANAAAYPTNTCVGTKQRAAATFCSKVLGAWKTWETNQDATARDLAITTASQKFSTSWSKAETVALKQAVDCVATTAIPGDVQTSIETAISNIVNDVNSGLDLTNKAEARCGKNLLAAAATDCSALLNAEATYVATLTTSKNPTKSKTNHDNAQTKARAKLATAFTKATAAPQDCPTTETESALSSSIDAVAADVVTNTIVSPNVDDTQFTTIATGPFPVQYLKRAFTPLCSRDTPYYFFVKRGSVNKVVVYYQGGGACWDYFTCHLGIFKATVDPNGDSPNNSPSGFADLSNPNNPFKDWNIVFTPYCTGDIHFGDTHEDYTDGNGNFEHINHYGYQNARVVEKWAREHFVNPDEVFVVGSSAGAYGAFFNAPILETVWPQSQFDVLADAGNGVITSSFLQTNFPSWDFVKNIPTYIPGVLDAINSGTGIPAYTQAVAAFFPNTNWAQYATAYDGGTGGQTGFYNVMVNLSSPGLWLTWWTQTCNWNSLMVSQAQATAAAATSNYRYYIGRGSRHTGWGSNNVVYSADAIGGTPALTDWVTAMISRPAGAAWTNVTCSNCTTLLSGDPRPSPLQSPFQQNGPDVDVVCP